MKVCLSFLILSLSFCLASQKDDREISGIFSEVLIFKENEKIRFEFLFYREIGEILDGRENRGFGKSPLVVDLPKIDGLPMVETRKQGLRIYSIESNTIKNEYFISFMRKDGLYKGFLRIDPQNPQRSVRVEFKK
ncbi:hypothetical protein CH380_16765 [Leptospira adleri]|uniref:Uncharacterized protein n=1 Tax=Leptospira adleri TaxID=2023186 RepID=A0A2M9YKV3_9LEPT|nr:hypothetical protein CH380_16765 [Leptospira adleri]PJZ62952.1 hypothetical protein CH376_05545 [Leptospira adleri]